MTNATGLVFSLLLLFPVGVSAAQPPKRLETVVVSGVQPGPGLWRVSRDGHELLILGTLSPLPKRMDWESRDVEAAVGRAQALLTSPSAELKVKGGAVRAVFLLPALLGARNNPDKAPLQELVPADLYARWLPLKAKYFGRDRGIEKRRPIFAAMKLYQEALDDAGLTLDTRVERSVRKLARRHDVPIVKVSIEIVLEAPGAAVKEFARTPLDDVACFRETLARVESDLEALQDRANAWATGDVAALRDARWTDQGRACADAFLSSAVLEKRGMHDLEQRLATAWLESAEKTIAEHEVSFAVLPVWQLIGTKGYAAELAARGYRVEAPDDEVAQDAP